MERLERLAERWPWLRTPIGVQRKVGEVNGSATASAVTLMFFVAVFPLIIVAIAVIGFISAGNEDFATDLIEDLGVDGSAADAVTRAVDSARDSRQAASVVGLVGLAWSGLGVAGAVSLAVNAPWQRKAGGMRTKAIGVGWLLGAAVLGGGAVASGALLNRTPEVVPRWLTSTGLLAAGLVLELLFFLWTLWALGPRKIPWRALVPGAVLGAIGFEVLKLLGTVLVPRMVSSSSALYGSLGVVLALLGWLAFFARLIIYASALNVVRWEQRGPGTVTVEVEVPRIEGEVPLAADRGGAVRPPEPVTTG